MLLAADGVPQSTAVALGLTWSAIVLAIGGVAGIGHIIEQRRAARASSAPFTPLHALTQWVRAWERGLTAPAAGLTLSF